MKSLRALKATGLILSAVVLGLMTVQGSYALWNATVPSNAGTIQSSNFSILVDNVEMSSRPQLDLSLAEINPGGSSYTKVTVTNNVNATSAMTVKPTIQVGLVPAKFAPHLTVESTVLLAGRTCETASYKGMPDLGEIAKGKQNSKTICVKVTLKSDTPASLWGDTITVPATLTVSQMPG